MCSSMMRMVSSGALNVQSNVRKIIKRLESSEALQHFGSILLVAIAAVAGLFILALVGALLEWYD